MSAFTTRGTGSRTMYLFTLRIQEPPAVETKHQVENSKMDIK